MLRAKNARVFKEEADIGEFGLKSREERGEGFFMVGEEIVASALVVIQFTDSTELEFFFLLHRLRHPLRPP